MIKPVWAAVAGVALLGSAGAAGVYVASPRGEEEAALQQQETSKPTLVPSPEASGTPTPIPRPDASPLPSLLPVDVPADWLAYSNPDGLFTVRYPPNWLELEGELYSSEPRKTGSHGLPSGVNVEIGYYPDDRVSGCGILSVSESGELLPEPGATPTTLGGVPAWQVVRLPGDPKIQSGTRIQAISLVYKGYCFNLAGYFTDENPDVATFLQIAGSFRFRF